LNAIGTVGNEKEFKKEFKNDAPEVLRHPGGSRRVRMHRGTE